MSEFQLQRGDLVSGVYRVKAALGRGGFAEVYRVEHVELHRDFALKLFSPRNRTDEEDGQRQQRFLREARAIHDLDHPNIVRLHHYGLDDERRPFLVMDYVEGRALSTLTGQMEPARAFGVVAQVLEALHAVHQTGLLHRDVKPSNVMLGEEGADEWVKLIDFGVAKHYDRSRRDTEWLTLTKADTFVGTPAYTAPELLLNQDPSPSADIYSAGLVLFELVFGDRAVSGENSIEVLSHQLLPEEFELPDEPALAPAARAVLCKMIAKDPARRFATAHAAARALTASLEADASLPGLLHAPAEAEPEAPNVSIASKPPTVAEPKSRRRSVTALVVVGALLLLVGAFAAFKGVGGETGEADATTAEPMVFHRDTDRAGDEAAAETARRDPVEDDAVRPDDEAPSVEADVKPEKRASDRRVEREPRRTKKAGRRRVRKPTKRRPSADDTTPFKPEPVD